MKNQKNNKIVRRKVSAWSLQKRDPI